MIDTFGEILSYNFRQHRVSKLINLVSMATPDGTRKLEGGTRANLSDALRAIRCKVHRYDSKYALVPKIIINKLPT